MWHGEENYKIAIWSDQYAFALSIRRDRWCTWGHAVFACDEVIRFNGRMLHLPKRKSCEDILIEDKRMKFSLIQEYGQRLSGHAYGRTDDENLLLDVSLKKRDTIGRMPVYSAEGTLLIGETEYPFAPAHSAALMFGNEESENLFSAMMINHTPILISLKNQDGLDFSNEADVFFCVKKGISPISHCQLQLSAIETAQKNAHATITRCDGDITLPDGRKMHLHRKWFLG